MLSSTNACEWPRTEPQIDRASHGPLDAAGSLRLHWPEYLMEAGEAGFYLLSACAFATLLWHPASPIQRYLSGDSVRRILMGLRWVG